MKQVSIFSMLVVFLAMGLGLTGCYKDVISPEADPDGPPQAVSYKDDLAPVFQAKCAMSGCHITGAKKPNLTVEASYQALVNGGYVNTVVPKASILYTAINGSMSEYLPSRSDKQKVYDWIRNGAPNN